MYSTNNIHTRSHLLKNKISHLVYEFNERKSPFYKVQCARDKIKKVFNLPQQSNVINNQQQRIYKTNNNIKREKILKQICYLSEHIYGGFEFDEHDRNASLKGNDVHNKYTFDQHNDKDNYKQNFFFTSSQNDNKHNVVNNSNSNNGNGNERNKKYMKVKCHSVSSIVNEDLWLNEHKGRFMKYIKLTNKKRKFNGCKANSQSTYVLPKLGYKCNYSMIIPNFPEDKSDLEKSKIENFKIKEIMDKRKPFPFKY